MVLRAVASPSSATFVSGELSIYNPSETFKYTVSTSAITADREITLPLLTSDDTFAFLGTDQTFSGINTFGASINTMNVDANGIVTFTGAGGLRITLNNPAFVVNGLPGTGLFFRTLPTVSYTFTNVTSQDVFRGHVNITNTRSNDWWSRDGFATDVGTPPTLSANTNNLDLETTTIGGGVIRLSASTNVNLTGVVEPETGLCKNHVIYNVGASNNITLTDQDANSTAANRFANTTNANIVLAPDEGANMWYDTVSNRWRVNKL